MSFYRTSQLLAAPQGEFTCTPFYLAAVNELFPMSVQGGFLRIDVGCATARVCGHRQARNAFDRDGDHAMKFAEPSRSDRRQDAKINSAALYVWLSDACGQSNLAAIRPSASAAIVPSDGRITRLSRRSYIAPFTARGAPPWWSFILIWDGHGEEFGSGHCWLPRQIKPVIAAVRIGLTADCNGEKSCRCHVNSPTAIGVQTRATDCARC